MAKAKLIYKADIEHQGSILIYKTGRNRYRVRYGAEDIKGDYEYAAKKMGYFIFHALGCNGAHDDDD